MAYEELIELLKTLPVSKEGGRSNVDLLAQLPAFIAPAAEPAQAAAQVQELAKQSLAGSTTSKIASTASNVASSALSGGHFAGSNPLKVLGGLTLLPVVTTLLKLFGGAKKEELPPLEKFDLPAPIRAEAGLSQSGNTFLIDRGVGDRIRPLQVPSFAAPNLAAPASPKQTTTSSHITVNVQAMDSQSFMDRREDIARAVREAMLQSHSLNDIVSEL